MLGNEAGLPPITYHLSPVALVQHPEGTDKCPRIDWPAQMVLSGESDP
jgi:hypothetical protein